MKYDIFLIFIIKSVINVLQIVLVAEILINVMNVKAHIFMN
jgi:hypothetical protein